MDLSGTGPGEAGRSRVTVGLEPGSQASPRNQRGEDMHGSCGSASGFVLLPPPTFSVQPQAGPTTSTAILTMPLHLFSPHHTNEMYSELLVTVSVVKNG